jgi:dTDP-4-dehydrorhamnose 3,5-epimerase
MQRFSVSTTPLHGVVLLAHNRLGDDRGYLERLYCAEELRPLLGSRSILQINRTHTALRGTVRGMHYQRSPFAELKIVMCLRGAVHDIVVDIRTGSPTFLGSHHFRLAADDRQALVIPEGFAHGFQALANGSELLYFHTARYYPEAEGGLNVRDPRLGIEWPLPVVGLSERDERHPMLQDDFDGVPA